MEFFKEEYSLHLCYESLPSVLCLKPLFLRREGKVENQLWVDYIQYVTALNINGIEKGPKDKIPKIEFK